MQRRVAENTSSPTSLYVVQYYSIVTHFEMASLWGKDQLAPCGTNENLVLLQGRDIVGQMFRKNSQRIGGLMLRAQFYVQVNALSSISRVL